MFDSYSNDVNSAFFFAEKIVFVEGESDAVVLRVLLEKKYGAAAHRISVISAAGNKNFSPFLRMLKAWNTAKIPHVVLTDFDSLTASCERAIIRGAKDTGYALAAEAAFLASIDAVLDKAEAEFSKVAKQATSFFADVALNVVVFTSDLEFALITDVNREKVAELLNVESAGNPDFNQGYSLNDLRRQIGSKLAPFSPMDQPRFKKPYIHRIIADTISLDSLHPDFERLIEVIDSL
jgi:hypothetical protein